MIILEKKEGLKSITLASTLRSWKKANYTKNNRRKNNKY